MKSCSLILMLLLSLPAFGQILLPEQQDSPPEDILFGRAVKLGRPTYPPAAKMVKAGGKVEVRIRVDEQGNVLSAQAVSGHPLLWKVCVDAALESKFTPTFKDGKPVRVTAIIFFNFAMTSDWEAVGTHLATILQGSSAVYARAAFDNTI